MDIKIKFIEKYLLDIDFDLVFTGMLQNHIYFNKLDNDEIELIIFDLKLKNYNYSNKIELHYKDKKIDDLRIEDLEKISEMMTNFYLFYKNNNINL